MSTAVYYHTMELPWSPTLAEERRFRVITIAMLIAVSMLSGIIAYINVPPPDRATVETLPPRLAKLIIAKKEIPPPPPKVEEQKPEEKPKETTAEKKEEKPKEEIEAARKKAANSGLLALQGELAGLRQHSALTKLKSTQKLLTTGSAATAKRSIITSSATKGSGGINTSQLSRSVASTELAGRDATHVEAPVSLGEVAAAGPQGKNRISARTIEEIQLIFDQNKGAIYSIYNRALRKDPSLKGKVVLSITIDPAGKVLACEILSNEVDSAEFAQKLVARVKLFDFGTRNVDTMVVTYPIEFLPS